MKRALGWVLAAPAWAQAADTAAPSVLGSGVGGQLAQTVLGLLVVLGVIVGLAWVLKRLQQGGPRGNAQVIELVSARALGPRDRLVLVQVGAEQILLGITPGRITPLHVMKQPVSPPQMPEALAPEFAQRLMELLGKDQKDKK